MPVYEFECEECHGGFERYLALRDEANPLCECGGSTSRVWALGNQHKGSDTYPYITKNIDPSGKPIEVTSAAHLDSLCKQYGVTHRPDAAWVEKEHLGSDRRGRPVYKEGSGMGLPGVWF